MSATTFKPVPTLQGLFSEPKKNHRRNFLKENKLSLKEKPTRLLTKQMSEQQKLEKERNEKLKHQRIQQLYVQRRSSSLANARVYDAHGRELPESDSLEQQLTNLSLKSNRSDNLSVNNNNKGGTYLECKPTLDNITSNNQRSRRSMHEQAPSIKSAASHKSRLTLPSQQRENMASSLSSHSVNKIIQTEDITDENFLRTALQKCSGDMKSIHDNRENYLQNKDSNMDVHSQEFMQTQQQAQMEQNATGYHYPSNGLDPNHLQPNAMHDQNVEPYQHYTNDNFDKQSVYSAHKQLNSDPANNYNNNMHLDIQQTGRTNASVGGDVVNNQATLASHRSHASVGSQYRAQNAEQPHINDVYIGDTIRNDVRNGEQINNEMGGGPLGSGRSRLSVMSTKSKRQVHQLGSRENIKLPGYMIRENREKAAEALRAAEYDPDCPPGYYLLSEEERKDALKAVKFKVESLVNELNRLPVTKDTMRIRNRRMAIEKELALLEEDSMSLAKQKVYVKRTLADTAAGGDS